MKTLPAAAVALLALACALTAPNASAQSLDLASRAPGSPPTATPTPQRPVDVAEAFDNEGWASRTAMPAARWGHAMVSYISGTYPDNDAYLYVISGADASFANTSLVSRYDVALDEWTAMAPLTPSRLQISAARIGDRIYVPGGYTTSFSPTTTLSIYDISDNTWSTGAPMPQATGDYAIAAYADRYLYVIGGYSGSVDLNVVQVYDSVANTWTTATPKIGAATAGLRAGIVGNQILVVGGYSQALTAPQSSAAIGVIDPLDPAIITWNAIAAYPGGPVGRFGSGTLVAAGPGLGSDALNAVIFAGGDPTGAGTAAKNDTWMYDFNDGTWKDGPAKPTGVSNISNMAGVAFDGKLHLVSTGGYSGSAVVAVNEWLTLGDEPSPDLSLAMSDGDATVAPGGSVLYTIDYASTGAGTTPAVTISDTVPAGTTFDAAASTPGWVCTPDANPGSVCEFDLGTLTGGANGSVTFALDSIYPVPAGVTQIVNAASIATAWADPEPANDAASEGTPFTAGSISLTASDNVTSEFGDSATFDIALLVPPSADVTIDFESSDTTEGSLPVSSVVFTPANWNQPQSVTVNGVDDNLDDGDIGYTVSGTIAAGSGNYDGVAIPTVALTNLDKLDLALTVSDADATAEPGDSILYTLAYNVTGSGAATATAVTVSDTVPAGSSFNAGASTPGWTCTPDANAGSVCSFALGTLAAGANGTLAFAVDSIFPVPNGVAQIVNSASIATGWSDALPANDSDSESTPFTGGSVALAPLDSQSSEAGDSASFQLTLQLRPSADVTINVASADATEGATTVSQLVFTPTDWNQPQTVTVTGVDDDLEDGDVGYTVESTVAVGSGNYEGVTIADFAATNLDDETAGSPTIAGMSSVRDTGDATLATGEISATPITQITVDFSEPMAPSAGDVVHFRLVGSGADGVVQTAGCAAALVGDDTAVALAEVVLATVPTNRAAVLIGGGHSLPLGIYRFTACDTLTDVSGNPIAAAVARDFEITASNLLANPNFDREAASWTPSHPQQTLWNIDDAGSAATSGSARIAIQESAAGAYGLEQCIDDAGFVAAAAAVRIDSAAPGAPDARIRVDYYAAPGCTGALVDSVLSAPVEGDTADAWLPLEVPAQQPQPIALSARVSLEVSGHTAPVGFTVDFDHAEVRQVAKIFSDYFETGEKPVGEVDEK
jgi:uncharacterized repeat protein (TIGR01451 family)